jgi:3-keto-disaccharide hydrolase
MGRPHLKPVCSAALVSACLVTLGLDVPRAGAFAEGRGTTPTWIGFAAAPVGEPWTDARAFGPWYSLHDGFGRTQVEQTSAGRVLSLRTRAAASTAETFSSLVHTRQMYSDLDFGVTVQTVAQLRVHDPNPWEVGWVLWRYSDNRHFYSFIVKPDGWELAKQDTAYAGSQRFLAYSYARSYPVGRPYRIRVRHVGDTVTIWVDGVRIVRYTDRERPYSSGSIALYAEDSSALYSPIKLNRGQT